MRVHNLILVVLISCFLIFHNIENNNNLIYEYSRDNFVIKNGFLFLNKKKYSGKLNRYDSVNLTYTITKYCRGKKNGKEIVKYENNTVAEERFYTKGVKTGIHRGWWRNGLQKFEYHFNASGIYNGKVKEWYFNGQKASIFNFVNGKEDGCQRSWGFNGEIKANYSVKDGQRYGMIGRKECYTRNKINE